MHVIAASSSSRTEWVVAEGTEIIEQSETAGLNPFFQSRREISHIIRLQLPETYFRRRLDHVYFYGAGCSSPEKNKIVESSLVAQFKTPTTVMTNLLGAARGMLLNSSGLVAILSTGANSCFYNGEMIVRNVRSGGYLLGDEGSNAYLGKLLLSDILKNIAPPVIIEAFYKEYYTDAESIMNEVYSSSQPNSLLAKYSLFLSKNLNHPYCKDMIYAGFQDFFRRNISFYDYEKYPLSIVGNTGILYRRILEEAAKDFGVKIAKINESYVSGLVKYHSHD